jgi:DNA phosphorothioation-dependent restriction protein DptG
MKDYEKMTVKELVDELTGLGVSFNKKSRCKGRREAC